MAEPGITVDDQVLCLTMELGGITLGVITTGVDDFKLTSGNSILNFI